MPLKHREEWTLAISTERLATAAHLQERYHYERALWWEGEESRAEDELREHGIEIREQPVTYGQRLNAVLDPERMARLEECRRKHQEHLREAETYGAYRAFLEDAFRLGVEDLPVGVDDFRYLHVQEVPGSPR